MTFFALGIDFNGIHEVGLDYYGCEGAKTAEFKFQLLRSSTQPLRVCDEPSWLRMIKFFHILYLN